jgi:hypothetical protein
MVFFDETFMTITHVALARLILFCELNRFFSYPAWMYRGAQRVKSERNNSKKKNNKKIKTNVGFQRGIHRCENQEIPFFNMISSVRLNDMVFKPKNSTVRICN